MITKAQWQAVEKELSGSFFYVKFEYQGVELAIQRGRLSESRTALAVYLDGTIKPGWGWFEEEIEDRPSIIKEVWKKSTKAKYKTQVIKEIEKCWGKRRAKKEYPELHEHYEYWTPMFSKSSVLCRQFKKLEGIKLIKSDCLVAEKGAVA